MDQIKDPEVSRLIRQIGEHYRANISNRFLRPIIKQFKIDETTWRLIEILTEKIEFYQYEGFYLDELYRQIAACARLVDEGNKSSIRGKISALSAGRTDRLLHEIAASTFRFNLQIFADLLTKLYVLLTDLDRQIAGNRRPVFSKIGELYNVGHLLVGVKP